MTLIKLLGLQWRTSYTHACLWSVLYQDRERLVFPYSVLMPDITRSPLTACCTRLGVEWQLRDKLIECAMKTIT